MGETNIASKVQRLSVLALGATVLLAGLKAKAQSAQMVSDWSMVLPSATVNEVIKAKNHAIRIEDKSFSYQETTAGQTVNASAEGLGMVAGMSISTAEFGANGDLSVGGSFQALTIRMRKLSFNVAGTLPLKGSCSGVEAVFLMPVKVDLKAQLSNQGLTMGVTAWDWDIGAQPFLWMTRSCEGPAGISEFMKTKVFQKFVSSEQARTVVMKETEGLFNTTVGGMMDKMFAKTVNGMDTAFKVEKFSWNATAFSFDGSATVKAGAACPSFTLTNSRTRVEIDAASKAAIKPMQLMFPEEMVLNTIKCAHETQALFYNGTTADFPDFTALMKNRTNQGYVWPDLQSFPTTQTFVMKTMSTDKMSLVPTAVSSGFSGTLTTQVTSYWSSNTGPYVTFYTPLTATVKVGIEGTKLAFSMSSPKNVKLVRRFERTVSDQYLDTTQFDTPVTNFLSTLKKTWDLPSVQLPNKTTFIPSALTTTPGKVWIFTMKN